MITFPDPWAEFLQLLPLKVEEASPYFGTFVLIRFVKSDGQNIKFRALMCDWFLKYKDEILACSDGDMEKSRQDFHSLAGSYLINVAKLEGERLELIFDSGKSFVLSANLKEYESDDELMTIYVQGQYEIRYTPSEGFQREFDQPTLH